MALVFNDKPVTTIKAKTTTGSYLTMAGCTDAAITPAQAAEQLNKIYAIAGKAVVADKNMTRTKFEGVEDDE